MSVARAVVLGVLVLGASPLFAQLYVGPVGYFDSEAVMSAFWVESGEARDLLAARDDYQERSRELELQIQELRARRAGARERDDAAAVSRLTDQIGELELFAQDLAARWDLQREEMLARLAGDDFWTRLYAAVRFVAESRGFLSVVDLADNPDVFYFAPEIDLTRAIVDELLERAAQ